MEQKPSRYRVWPLIRLGPEQSWSVSQDILAHVWLTMQATGRDKIVFYDGAVNSIESFISFVTDKGRSTFFVTDYESQSIPGLAWLDTFGDGCAFAHFCFLTSGNKDVAQCMMDFWRQVLRGAVVVLIGIIPESNTKAIEFTKKIIGFSETGKIPKICRMYYKGNIREDGIILAYEMEE